MHAYTTIFQQWWTSYIISYKWLPCILITNVPESQDWLTHLLCFRNMTACSAHFWNNLALSVSQKTKKFLPFSCSFFPPFYTSFIVPYIVCVMYFSLLKSTEIASFLLDILCASSLVSLHNVFQTNRIIHGSSKKCLAISQDRKKLVMEDCNLEEGRQKWKFENYDPNKKLWRKF